ncbi:MAG: phosphonate ABC transporter ATP-binding protein [Bdellovibrionia bacterium]
MAQPLLSVKNLVKTYPNGVRALKGVSFDVQKGEFLVVIGLSGSGKSTLLRCFNQLNQATEGQVLLHEQDITRVRGSEVRELRKKVAMIFQQFNLIPRHTVMSNVLMGSLSRTSTFKSLVGMFAAEDIEKARGFLKLVGIEEKAYMRASQLSGGQQQRVAIARALTQGPEILLADEPVASLDPATCHSVMDYLEKVNKELGITIVCNLHFLSLVRRYATRVIALKEGNLVFNGSPRDITEEWFRKIYGEDAREVHVN